MMMSTESGSEKKEGGKEGGSFYTQRHGNAERFFFQLDNVQTLMGSRWAYLPERREVLAVVGL